MAWVSGRQRSRLGGGEDASPVGICGFLSRKPRRENASPGLRPRRSRGPRQSVRRAHRVRERRRGRPRPDRRSEAGENPPAWRLRLRPNSRWKRSESGPSSSIPPITKSRGSPEGARPSKAERASAIEAGIGVVTIEVEEPVSVLADFSAKRGGMPGPDPPPDDRAVNPQMEGGADRQGRVLSHAIGDPPQHKALAGSRRQKSRPGQGQFRRVGPVRNRKGQVRWTGSARSHHGPHPAIGSKGREYFGAGLGKEGDCRPAARPPEGGIFPGPRPPDRPIPPDARVRPRSRSPRRARSCAARVSISPGALIAGLDHRIPVDGRIEAGQRERHADVIVQVAPGRHDRGRTCPPRLPRRQRGPPGPVSNITLVEVLPALPEMPMTGPGNERRCSRAIA